jgi:transposase-like protein
MDPTTACCPNEHWHARGQTGQGNIGLHSQQEQRCICHACHTTCSARTGSVFYRLRTSAETVVLVVTWLAHGYPVQAIVAAFGGDERPVAAGWARSGRQGQTVHASLVEPPRDLGPGQADALRGKQQGGSVWLALARRVTTRWGRGGQGAAGPAPAPPADGAGEALGGLSALVGLYRWRGGLPPGHAGDLSRPRADGHGRTAPAAAVAPCLARPSGPTRRASSRRRHAAPHCRGPASTRRDAPPSLARRWGAHHRGPGAAARDMPGTPCAAGAPVPGAGPPYHDAARGPVRGGHGLELVHTP